MTQLGGHVDKFLGEGLVCFFGVPQAHEDDAERAGLSIVSAVQDLGGKDIDPHRRIRACTTPTAAEAAVP